MVRSAICIGAMCVLSGSSWAQSSVSLYGLMDVGINYINNDGGKSNVDMTSGVLQGNRFGLLVARIWAGALRRCFASRTGSR